MDVETSLAQKPNDTLISSTLSRNLSCIYCTCRELIVETHYHHENPTKHAWVLYLAERYLSPPPAGSTCWEMLGEATWSVDTLWRNFKKFFYLTNLNVVWNKSKIPLSNLPHNVRLGNLVRNFNPLLLTCWLSTFVATRLSFWHGYPSQFLPPTASWWPKKPKPFDHSWLISEQ